MLTLRDQITIVAHRCRIKDYPQSNDEYTREIIIDAVHSDVDGLEFDVFYRDGNLYVEHGGSKGSMTLCDFIAILDACDNQKLLFMDYHGGEMNSIVDHLNGYVKESQLSQFRSAINLIRPRQLVTHRLAICQASRMIYYPSCEHTNLWSEANPDKERLKKDIVRGYRSVVTDCKDLIYEYLLELEEDPEISSEFLAIT